MRCVRISARTRLGRTVRNCTSERLNRRSANRDFVAARFEDGGGALHAERLDAKKRARGRTDRCLGPDEATVPSWRVDAREATTRGSGWYTLANRFDDFPYSEHCDRGAAPSRARRCGHALRARRVNCRRAPAVLRHGRALVAAQGRARDYGLSIFSRAVRQPGSVVCGVFGTGGHSIADYGDEIDTWVDALRAAPEITRVDAGVVDQSRDFGWLADRQLLLLGDGALSTKRSGVCARVDWRRLSRPAASCSASLLPRSRSWCSRTPLAFTI